MIELSHIVKTFETDDGTVKAVSDVSLHVEKGSIYGIIGFSGAGKSTLVRCINLLERPDSGTVKVGGTDLTSLTDAELRSERRKIGMIFQHFNLMPSRTVYGNVELAMRHSPLSKSEKHKKIVSLLELVGLSGRMEAYPSQLSGGQKQRVAIARALANDPNVLLCDEATSALDPQTTHSILALLRELNARLGLTVVVITHQMGVIKEICNRVAVMQGGKIVEENDIVSIFSHPQADLTKNFINSANNVNKFLDMVRLGEIRVNREAGEKILLLTYVGESSNEPLMVVLYEKFGVKANVVFGTIDFFGSMPLGKLGITLSGTEDGIASAIGYIRSIGVTAEELTCDQE